MSATPQLKKKNLGGFPGGSVVKNPPANAEDTGLIPDEGRSHIKPVLQCPRAARTKSMRPRARALQQKMPPQ